MDRFGAVTTWDDENEQGHRLRVDVSYPSRGKVIPALKEALENGMGPVLLTGEPGSGKTWVSRAVLGELPDNYRALNIDLSPAVGPLEFHRLILHRLGIDPRGHRDIATARAAIEDALADDSAEGRRSILVVEEAHNASDAVFEELRVALNRRGRPEGFWAMLVIGQSPLARRLLSRRLAGFSSRLAGRIHLRAFDVVEFADSIRVQPASPPGELAAGEAPRSDIDASRPPSTATPVSAEGPQRAAWDPPTITANRPPLREEEGMIEVGWDAASDSTEELDSTYEGAPRTPTLADQTDGDTTILPSHPTEEDDEEEEEDDHDEPIHDHYTALQAWKEWSRNRERGLDDPRKPSTSESDETTGPLDSKDAIGPTFWADERQEFAPYSQLFSRFKKESETK